MEIDQAIEAALDGDALLFTGAGFSIGATNSRGTPIKTAADFAAMLANEIGISSESGLEDVSDEYATVRGVDALIGQLRGEFTAKAVCAYHEVLATVPWRRIYTTNYDDVMELACKGAGLHSLTLAEAIPHASKGVRHCVHLNGFVGHLSQGTATTEVKLTEGSHLLRSIESSPWGVAFRQDIAAARAVFFTGYSLADLDIKRLLFPDDALKAKAFFVLGETPTEGTVRRAAKFGSVLRIGAADLASLINAKRSDYVPAERHVVLSSSFRARTGPTVGKAATDRDVVDLLLDGRIRPDLAWSSIHGGKKYLLVRHQAKETLTAFDKGYRGVVVHSALGNGKSMIAETVVLMAIEHGYSVYEVRRESPRILDECQQILEADPRPMFLVEDYPEYMELLRFLFQKSTTATRVFLTARSQVHDFTVDKLLAAAPQDTILEIQVDRVSRDEGAWLVEWLDEYGLWGESASWTARQKRAFIEEKCRGEMHGVLVKALQAPQMVARYGALLDKLSKKQDYHEVVLAALVLNVLQFAASANTLADLCGEAVFESQFRHDRVIDQLMDFGRGEVRLRSAVASQFILQRVADPMLLVDVLIGLAHKADAAAGASPYYERLLKELMRFGRVQYVMPEEQRRPALLKYYESIKNLPRAKRNPLFWLQYAIACMTIGELTRAGKYFKNAYAFAGDPRYDTYQIDNHYARYILVSGATSPTRDSAVAALREARAIIERQVLREREHHPYRVASAYYDLFAVARSSLNADDLVEFSNAAMFVLDRIEKLPGPRQLQRYVVECRRAMKRIIAEALESQMKR